MTKRKNKKIKNQMIKEKDQSHPYHKIIIQNLKDHVMTQIQIMMRMMKFLDQMMTNKNHQKIIARVDIIQ